MPTSSEPRPLESHALQARSALLVPTRSLANILLEEHHVAQLEAGRTAWLPPVIITWSDFVQELWVLNQTKHASLANVSLLTAPQSLVLWERVLNAAKRQEDELRLLNVMQTAKAAQAARQTCLDWQLSERDLADFANLDLSQFLAWQRDYIGVCDELSMLDSAGATAMLCACNDLRSPYAEISLYAFDLQTSAQHKLLEKLEHGGVKVMHRNTVRDAQIKHAGVTDAPPPNLDEFQMRGITCYSSDDDELKAVLIEARELLHSQPQAKLAIVVPDLQHRLAQVTEAARTAFYPSLTPLRAQQQHGAYRISLGKPLSDWSAIGTALRCIELLKSSMPSREFALLLNSQHGSFAQRHSMATTMLVAWMAERRIHTVRTAELSDLLVQFLAQIQKSSPSTLADCKRCCQALNALLAKRAEIVQALNDKPTLLLAPSVWATQFRDWLDAWQWSSGYASQELDSQQYQLAKRFERCLQELGTLDVVLRQCGLSRAVDWLNKLCNDGVFLPQAEPAPILISGIYEAIGRQVDVVFLTGMTEDFPAHFPKTAFIPANALLHTEHPSANHARHYQQMTKVLHSLLAGAAQQRVSYAHTQSLDPENKRSVSPLFRKAAVQTAPPSSEVTAAVPLELYQDEAGLPWPQSDVVRHGMSVFKEQSSCAFKAFATHRLQCRHVDEPEFGLEASAQGTVIHHVLNRVWTQLGGSEGLSAWLALPDAESSAQMQQIVAAAIDDLTSQFNTEQIKLVRRESGRYSSLVQEWLQFEARRPARFAVLESEWVFTATLGGIEYRGIIDRIDAADGEHIVIIDYKTGMVTRSDWTGERLTNPQMPLYYLAHQQLKSNSAAGIAYAQVRRSEMKFEELAEDGLLTKPSAYTAKRAELWAEQKNRWQPMLEQLAADFMQGVANVNPVDEQACSYCPYGGMCRIQQLQGRLGDEDSIDESEAEHV